MITVMLSYSILHLDIQQYLYDHLCTTSFKGIKILNRLSHPRTRFCWQVSSFQSHWNFVSFFLLRISNVRVFCTWFYLSFEFKHSRPKLTSRCCTLYLFRIEYIHIRASRSFKSESIVIRHREGIVFQMPILRTPRAIQPSVYTSSITTIDAIIPHCL